VTNRDAMELEDLFIWACALHSQTLYISNQNSMNIPFIFESACRVANKKVLLDSGTTECFMDERMVN
jgi:hypothetical protein